MCDVGPSFANPAQAIVSLLLSAPGVSAIRDRVSIETELASLLHSHVSSSTVSLPEEKQKISKILVLLKSTDDAGVVSFNGISWHRLLVRCLTFQHEIPNSKPYQIATSTSNLTLQNSKQNTGIIRSHNCSATLQLSYLFLFFYGFLAQWKVGGQPARKNRERRLSCRIFILHKSGKHHAVLLMTFHS
jgi:hypothetical protein